VTTTSDPGAHDDLVSNDGAPRRRHAVRGVVAGLVAAFVALGVAELVAGISSDWRSPVLDVGDRVVDLVPPAVKELAIEWFGTADKVALLIGIGSVLAVYAAAVGVVAVRGRLRLGMAGVALFGVVGAIAALGARGERPVTAILPSLLGAAAGVGSLWWLCRLRPAAADLEGDHDGDPTAQPVLVPPSRRTFLTSAGVLGAVGVSAAAGGRWLGGRFSAAASRAQVVLPRPRRPNAPLPDTVSLDVEGISPFTTPNRDFYRIDTALTVPQVPVDTWRLRIDGMVSSPLELSYEQLLDRELVEADITMTCVSNEVGGGLVGNARWLGVRLDELLEEVGVEGRADQVVGRSVDGYTCGFPVAALDGRDALVAVGMNGEPLPLRHGFPARLIVPGLYGYVSATKWLSQIELTRFDQFDHYWVPRGYAVEAPIKTASRIDTPKGLARVPAGPTPIAGVAWAQTRGIDAVEVQVDDGEWQPAELAEQLNDAVWRQWVLRWDATPGRHTVRVRAIDGTGAIQTEERSEPLPDGSSGLHQIVVLVDD
jgi:DMSO/TMAO reductase YedYZ molybdopterin-dependent catalytic subunit